MANAWRARAALLLAFGCALSACGDGGDTASPAPITPSEQDAVADAAEMLEERVPAQDTADVEANAPNSNE